MTVFGTCDLPARLTQQAKAMVMTNHTVSAFIFIMLTVPTISIFCFVKAGPASQTAKSHPQVAKQRDSRTTALFAYSSGHPRARSINRRKAHVICTYAWRTNKCLHRC